MDLNTWWYFRAFAIFVLFNFVAVGSVLLFHKKKWHVDPTQFRHYTSLIFQICGIIYALFLSFIVWDVWERFYDVKRTIQTESKNLVDLYRDSTVFEPEMEEAIQAKLKQYLAQAIYQEWPKMEWPGALERGDDLVHEIWQVYYNYTPKTEKDKIWYTESILKLNEFSKARLTRIFNNSSSVGILRWVLLIVGGLFLTSIPCFFKIDLLFFKLLLVLFLANIIAFLLFMVFSLDHPFTGYVEIDTHPFEYAQEIIQPW
ncbi:MAG: hypothetical protein S4CHLAM2_13990 [Chlamydiales bacterium]|nr:hypothetical protein [Chlamydiales bacterium]